ncbi:MAG: DUF222 domain-containing protein, partial [Sandaracinaceae bacterium]
MLNTCPGIERAPAPDMDAVEAELARLEASINSAIHRRLELIRLIDESGRWAHQGCKSCAHWLSWRLGIRPSTAREQVRVATKLKDMPRLDDELKHGRVTYSQVRAITRGATPATEATLIDVAKHSTASQLERIVRGIENVRAQEDPERAHDAIKRWVYQRPMPDGSHRIEAQLTADQATLVMAAIRSVQAIMQDEQRQPLEERAPVDSHSQLTESLDDDDAGTDPFLEERADELRVLPFATSRPGGELPRPTLADAFVRMAEQLEAACAQTSQPRSGADRAAIGVHFAEDRRAASPASASEPASAEAPAR